MSKIKRIVIRYNKIKDPALRYRIDNLLEYIPTSESKNVKIEMGV